MTRNVLLTCGILSSVLYGAMNFFLPMWYEGYSCASQTVSELSAIGAPTRPAWVLLGIVYTLLLMAFGWGISQSAAQNRRLLLTGRLLFAYGVISLLWPFAPMHMRGAGFSLTDTMHIVMASITVLLMTLAMGFGARSFGNCFRLYSIATIVILLAFGILTGLDGPRIAANLPTPWVGVWERVNIGVFLLWVIVLAWAKLQYPEKDLHPPSNFSL